MDDKSVQKIHMPKKIIVISNTAWYIFNFRLSLMKSLRDKGHSIVAISPADGYVRQLEDEGFSYITCAMNRKGKNPLEDIALLYRFWRVFKCEKPDVVLTYTPKPNIYASIAARFCNIPVINSITGLGNVFIQPGFVSAIVLLLYRFAFSRSYKIFFQNNDDMKLFSDKGLVRRSNSEWVPGSGVDIQKFVPQSCKKRGDAFVFMLVSRMIWDKGVGEFVEAAKILKKKYSHVECRLVGFIDTQNPRGISRKQIQSWVEEKSIYYDGSTDNILGMMSNADCIVLPSFYREGVPKVLLEAASMEIPIITTDSVGCRDAVEDGVTGFLCKAKNVQDLSNKMQQMLLLSEEERKSMGLRGRDKMIREFDERFVIHRYIYAIESALHK